MHRQEQADALPELWNRQQTATGKPAGQPGYANEGGEGLDS